MRAATVATARLCTFCAPAPSAEIIMNGQGMQPIIDATQAAIKASVDTPGLIMISAGNYGGRLGKSFIFLDPSKQPAPAS